MENISLGYFAQYNKNLTASLAAWLLAYFPDSNSWDSGQFQSLVAGVEGACLQNKSSAVQKSSVKRDSQVSERILHFPAKDAIVKVYTDYDVAREILNVPGVIEMVEVQKDADFLLTVAHFKAFTTLPLNQRVCQFPFEAGFVRKVRVPTDTLFHLNFKKVLYHTYE